MKFDVYEEYDITEKVGNYQLDNNKNCMQNGVLTLSLTNIKSAFISAAITVILALAGYVIGVGDVYKIDMHELVNAGTIAGLVAIVSILKSWLTSNSGNFLGIVKTVDSQ